MKETIDTIIKWHTETFPDATLVGQVIKFIEEEKEYHKAPLNSEDSLFEVADMVIVSAGIARFNYAAGMERLIYTIENSEFNIVDIWPAVEKKMEKNRKRIWNKTADGQYHHENGIED